MKQPRSFRILPAYASVHFFALTVEQLCAAAGDESVQLQPMAWTFPAQPKKALLGFWIFRNPEASGRLDLMKFNLPEARNLQNPSPGADLMKSKLPEPGFNEIQASGVWISSNPILQGFRFFEFS